MPTAFPRDILTIRSRIGKLMRVGVLIAVVLGVFGLSAMLFAFLTQASPYVTVKAARSMSADNLHLAGDIRRETVQANARENWVKFTLVDKAGDETPVLYRGPQPANMGSATQVVAVGGMKDGVFHARELLLKCPSKYESQS